MRLVEITRGGEDSVTDQLAEMRQWLRREGIEPLQLEPVAVLRARVHFRAGFALVEHAERFRRQFDEARAELA